MKILIVSGFLGAGKTTFIRTMTEKTGRDFVVFENEYGQTDVDARQLSGGALNVWELAENCVCCTGRADFLSSILTISSTIDPEYLIVEPTGAALLSGVLEGVERMGYDRIALLKPVVIVDGLRFDSQRKEFSALYADQIRSAGVIVVSKMERTDASEQKRLADALRTLNPTAEIVAEPYSKREPAWWLSLLRDELTDAPQASDGAEAEAFERLSLHDVSFPTPTHLIAFLDALVFGVFGRVVRAKGRLPCGGEWLKFDVADGAWAITGAETEQDAQCVFIGKNLYRAGLRELTSPGLKELYDPTRAKKRAGWRKSST